MSEIVSKSDPNAWLVFGWKISQTAVKKAITGMPPEEMERESGLRVIVSTNGQEAILGKVIASGVFANGMADLGFFQADEDALERVRLRRRIEELGFGKVVTGEPTFWFAGG